MSNRSTIHAFYFREGRGRGLVANDAKNTQDKHHDSNAQTICKIHRYWITVSILTVAVRIVTNPCKSLK